MIARGARWARRTAARGWKAARQTLASPADETAALFVVGAQRSGTTMLLDVLEALPETWVYQEHHRAAFARDWHLRPVAVRRRLLERATCRWVVFKPLFDLQRLDDLLEEHPGSRALFVYRDHLDVARSSAEKWGDAMVRAVHRLATEEPCTHWMADRLPPERKAKLAALESDLDPAAAGALRWWLRNELFFDLGLADRGDRVKLVRYEELVTDPPGGFAPLFSWLELRPDPAAVSGVSARSVGRGADLTLPPAVSALCRDLEDRLDAVRTAGRSGG